ncbi:MAG: hypothetical protein WED32_02675, partial [Patescibacteria group bacterium]
MDRCLHALRERAREGAKLNWGAMVRLIEAGLGAEGSWHQAERVETRKTPTWLLINGLEGGQFQLGIRSRARMWAILRALAADRSPTHDDENRRPTGAVDLGYLTLNTVRPLAVFLITAYATWLNEQHDGPRRMPTAARALLVQRLDDDPSVAVWSAIGERIAVMYWLDRNWLISTLPRLFPSDPSRSELRDAAWEGYLNFRNVYLDLFVHLLPEYARSVERIADTATAEEPTEPQKRLAEHLLLLAKAGTVSPDSTDGLLRRFFELASAALAAEALHQFGWQLWATRDQDRDVDEKGRIRVLWQAVASWAAEGLLPKQVLGGFGWWFASGQLDHEWSREELERLVVDDVGITELHVVFERLRNLVPQDPLGVARITEAIVARELSDDGLHSDDLRAIASAVLQEDSEARTYGEALVSRMRSRGFSTFPDA